MRLSFQSDLHRLTARIDHLGKGVKAKAISAALNDTLAVVNTEVAKNIRKEGYNIAAAKIKQRIKIKKSSTATLEARLTATDRPVNLKHYGAKAYGKKGLTRGKSGELAVVTGGGVSVKVKGQRKRIKHAFISPASGNVLIRLNHLKAGAKGFMAKRALAFGGGFNFKNEHVKPLFGPGVNTMVANQAVNKAVGVKAKDHFPKRLTHYVKRLLAKNS